MGLDTTTVILDYMGESGEFLTMPIDAEGNTDPDATVGLTIVNDGSRNAIRFGDLFRNTHPDVFNNALFLQLLRCAWVRSGSGQPNSHSFRTAVNSAGAANTGENGIWMPRKTYWLGEIERLLDESPNNPSFRVHYADSLANASAGTASENFDFTLWEIDESNRRPASIVKGMLPGIIQRRLGGTFVNPPVASTLNTFRNKVNTELVIEY